MLLYLNQVYIIKITVTGLLTLQNCNKLFKFQDPF